MSAIYVDRLAYDATTEAEVHQYYQTRALQLAWNDYTWSHELIEIPGGFFTQFTHDDGTVYDSYFILKQHRGKGYAKSALQYVTNPILTIEECNVAEFFRAHNIDVVVEEGIYTSDAYRQIQYYYGTRTPKRAPVYLMNHIDEGVMVLKKINATLEAQQAFCLHPLVQGDADLKAHAMTLSHVMDPYVLTLALEYRNIANQYLSHRSINSLDDIALSPLQEVNDMLIADKVQNYKDFLLYHKGTHPRSKELDKYFNNWLMKLGVTNFNEHFEMLKAI